MLINAHKIACKSHTAAAHRKKQFIEIDTNDTQTHENFIRLKKCKNAGEIEPAHRKSIEYQSQL